MSRPLASLTRSHAVETPTTQPNPVPLLLRVVVVLLAGVALGLSWQPYGLWPLLLVGIPAFTLAVRGLRPLVAVGLGYLFGLIMLTLAVSWVHVLGTWIAALLIIFMALYFGLLGLALTLVSRLRWWPLAAACCWVLDRVHVLADSVRGLRLDPDRVRGRRHTACRVFSDHRSRGGLLRCSPARPAHCLDRPYGVDSAAGEAGATEPCSSSPP